MTNTEDDDESMMTTITIIMILLLLVLLYSNLPILTCCMHDKMSTELQNSVHYFT